MPRVTPFPTSAEDEPEPPGIAWTERPGGADEGWDESLDPGDGDAGPLG